MDRVRRAATLAFLVALVVLSGAAQPAAAGTPASPAALSPAGLRALERQVQEFTLPNGLRFLLVERHEAPVFSFQTVVGAGSANDQIGTTGLAHMMEHMAFKGTPWVGTSEAADEPARMAAEERAYIALAAERARGSRADSTRLRRLAPEFEASQEAAGRGVVTDEFIRILERAGAQGVNAYTSSDVTAYMYSIPSNRLELWAVMEGGRLTHPVFREFYKEREVVIEERRMSTESSPFGRLAEEFTHAAFVAHPYGFGTIGFASDLASFTRTEGEAYFRRHYVAPNITIAVVGDVTLAELRAMAERWFRDIPPGPAPPPLDTVEPEQRAERRVIVEDEAQSIVMMGWHVPACSDPRYLSYEALTDLLGGGDHARLQKALVKEQRLAVSVETTCGFPGERYPSIWGVLAIPAPDVAPDSVERAVLRVLDDIQRSHPITQQELDGYKVRVRSGKLGAAEDNAGLAGSLATAQALYGDWREFFRGLERVQGLTLADLSAAMSAAFRKSNQTTAMMVNPAPADSTAGGR